MNGIFRQWMRGLAVSGVALAAGCTQPFDFDMRGNFDQFSTAEAARNATFERPQPDERGVISYPSYQVVVARRGESVAQLAARIGLNAEELGKFNGLTTGDVLRSGEVLALPRRVAEPAGSTATAAAVTGPTDPVDIGTIASTAIDNAGDRQVQTATLAPVAAPAPAAQPTGPEPIRHKVQRGETAYTVARLYNVSVRTLAEWNGLDRDFTVREGQMLIVPSTGAQAPASAATATTAAVVPAAAATSAATTEPPGAGSPTPVPPSASTPLPQEKTQPAAKPVEKPAAPDLSKQQTKTASTARMTWPVQGRIIREYSKGRNDGIDIAADPGTAIKAAEAGTVAAITSDADNNHVIVIRHEGKLLTIYSNVDKISVKEKQTVTRGQKIAEIASGASPYVHFEVRKGLDSTDPVAYLQ